MTDLVDINDHMARACECGCVRFNLLRSGAIECDDCGKKQPNLNWSETMDTRIQAEKHGLAKLFDEQPKATEAETEAAKPLVKQAIKDNGGYAYRGEIKKRVDGKATDAAVSAALNALIGDGSVRQKEDDIEHDWEYILTRKGKES
jgi:hypothetical protein